jgi:ribonuclease R
VILLDGRARFLVGEPLFRRGRRVTAGRVPREARPGRMALVRPGAGGRVDVLRVLGEPHVARDVIEALMLDRGLRRSFPAPVERAAADAAEHPQAAAARRDLRDLPTFTIDPVTAKDFDDAISAEDLGGGRTRVWVHIADVSAHVRPGDPVDREAYRRATSVYVPGAVEPMLPEALSNGVCSLVPGQDRLAVTVELEFEGVDVTKASFGRTLIRSDVRLDYEQVDRILDGHERADDPWAKPLAAARAVAARLDEARHEAGHALSIESVEPEFRFDRGGHVTEASTSVQTESHRLIEHLMIAANQAVARLLSERRAPALYRVHERPDPEAVDRLLGQLASLDVPTPPAPERMTQADAAEIVAQASALVDAHVRRTGHGRVGLTYLVLRALQQAHYTPQNLGHAGLGLTHYCHFTSPIRRYPDLVCHRALLAAVGAGEDPPPAHALEEAGIWSSARERAAMVIERDSDRVAQCFLLERELFEEGYEQRFEGEVTGLVGGGAFVRFGDPGETATHEGFLPVRRIPGGWWELNEARTILLSDEGGAIRIGAPVAVRVERVDAPRGRVDLLPAEGA